MKKKSHPSACSTAKAALALTLGLTAGGWLASLPLLVQEAQANPELDRQYLLQTIGYLKSWDNVDGLFAEYVSEAYREFFAKQSRFVLQDLSKADAILSQSKLPYHQVIDDVEILGQLSRAMRTESILRTKIYKEGPRYRFTVEWLHAPKMELIASETFTLDEPRGAKAFGIEEIKKSLQQALTQLIAKLPFIATVTGRDNQSVTLNVGAADGVKPGDTLVIATLEDVKKHPLLKSIVDWRLAQTGLIQLDQVDESISFGRVMEEEPGHRISRYQKVAQIVAKPIEPGAPRIQEKAEQEEDKEEPPRLGFGQIGAQIGSYNRQFSDGSGTSGRTGGGIYTGARGEGQLWLNPHWFTDLQVSFGFSGYAPSDIATGTETGARASMSAFGFRAAGGYAYSPKASLTGPKAWVKAGFQSQSYQLPTLAAELTEPNSFRGLFLGIGGDLPVRGRFGVNLNLDVGLLSSAGTSAIGAGNANGANSLAFSAGAYYRYDSRMTIRLGLDIDSNSADYSSGATLTHRVVAFGPSLLYYF